MQKVHAKEARAGLFPSCWDNHGAEWLTKSKEKGQQQSEQTLPDNLVDVHLVPCFKQHELYCAHVEVLGGTWMESTSLFAVRRKVIEAFIAARITHDIDCTTWSLSTLPSQSEVDELHQWSSNELEVLGSGSLGNIILGEFKTERYMLDEATLQRIVIVYDTGVQSPYMEGANWAVAVTHWGRSIVQAIDAAQLDNTDDLEGHMDEAVVDVMVALAASIMALKHMAQRARSVREVAERIKANAKHIHSARAEYERSFTTGQGQLLMQQASAGDAAVPLTMLQVHLYHADPDRPGVCCMADLLPDRASRAMYLLLLKLVGDADVTGAFEECMRRCGNQLLLVQQDFSKRIHMMFLKASVGVMQQQYAWAGEVYKRTGSSAYSDDAAEADSNGTQPAAQAEMLTPGSAGMGAGMHSREWLAWLAQQIGGAVAPAAAPAVEGSSLGGGREAGGDKADEAAMGEQVVLGQQDGPRLGPGRGLSPDAEPEALQRKRKRVPQELEEREELQQEDQLKGPEGVQQQEQLPGIKPEPEAVPYAEARYTRLAALPFNVEELADLQRRYLEPSVSEADATTRTRHGTLRHRTSTRCCRPAAQGHYSRLWPHLQRLAQQADEDAAAAQVAGGSMASGGTTSSSPGIGELGHLPASVLLLRALRMLQEYESGTGSTGLEAGPLDAALGRFLPEYGAEVAAGLADAAEVNMVDVVDLTFDEIDVETYVVQSVAADGAAGRARPVPVKLEEGA
ncbi:hypothetical protein TSOC_007720 [Tetrabaena socialis]|uniref:Uncharacterized protein n=1 Tax=Tetrabaena socialis TaxID=47790 RepID=A0A2J8A0D2_9CHLO|nr:hypothetical protein TSOC_007720 [Tetrabaena socialis]|eukprot:PNH05966.1 hypothetical protein TSOC_007720 [Tetrabaena socialis]